MDDNLLIKEIRKIVEDESKVEQIRELLENICDYCHDAWKPCYCHPAYDI